MNQQKRIDKILDAVEIRIPDEVSALLGAELTVTGCSRDLVSKADAFDQLTGKQICARMDVTGDVEGKGCLLIGIKDAIRLGGTLIMLPASELDEVIGREEYNEEVEDSYGEIANIIAGSFTKDFEEMYPKSCRFVRKEQEILVPAKVVAESSDPVEDQMYYQVSSSMTLDGRQMGELTMLVPASPFELHQDELATKPTAAEEAVPSGSTEAASESEESAEEKERAAPQKEEPVSPRFDVVKHKKRVDRLLAECQEKMEIEIGGLLGVDLTLTDLENSILTKEDFFDQLTGRQILADFEVVGECEGTSYFSISIKDAIHLGGILIMLPPSELESVISEENFSEDGRDAYGEVANIVSGVYTSTFEEQYIKKLRFIKKELQEVVPAKVIVETDEPIPDRVYYNSSMSLAIDGKQLGKIHMLFPVDMLQLQSEGAEETGQQSESSQLDATGAQVSEEAHEAASAQTMDSASGSEPGGTVPSPSFDVEKNQKRVDKILAACQERIGDEVGALLCTDVKLGNLQNRIISKEDFFFDEVSGKQVIANLDVVGELEGKSYLAVDLRDAIRIGGVLIMLPASELESTVASENFGEDSRDAYGEIANIISGAYTAVFEEQYTKKIRFIKTDFQEVLPMKVDIGSVEPIPDQEYYLSCMDLTIGENQLGKLNMLFPLDLLQLDRLRNSGEVEAQEEAAVSAQQVAKGEPGEAAESSTEAPDAVSHGLDILLIGDDEAESSKIADVLGNLGYSVKSLTFKDNLHSYIPGQLKAVYLVMNDVNEQAFGAAIKVSSACSLPIVAAGAEWTRSKVIKAVKYGVRDILLTPASKEEIEENVANNLLKLAA